MASLHVAYRVKVHCAGASSRLGMELFGRPSDQLHAGIVGWRRSLKLLEAKPRCIFNTNKKTHLCCTFFVL